MTNMESLESQLSEQERQTRINERAVAAVSAKNVRREARGYAVMSAFMGYGKGALGGGMFGKVSHIAKLFCIGFAFLVPSLLVWYVLL